MATGNLTFAIIKPDAVGAGHTGKIIDRIIDGVWRMDTLAEVSSLMKAHR